MQLAIIAMKTSPPEYFSNPGTGMSIFSAVRENLGNTPGTCILRTYFPIYTCSATVIATWRSHNKGEGITIVYNPNNDTAGGGRTINQSPSQHRFRLISKLYIVHIMFFSASCKSKNPRQKTDSGEEETTSCASRRKTFNLQRNCMSLNDLDYENVRLVDPATGLFRLSKLYFKIKIDS